MQGKVGASTFRRAGHRLHSPRYACKMGAFQPALHGHGSTMPFRPRVRLVLLAASLSCEHHTDLPLVPYNPDQHSHPLPETPLPPFHLVKAQRSRHHEYHISNICRSSPAADPIGPLKPALTDPNVSLVIIPNPNLNVYQHIHTTAPKASLTKLALVRSAASIEPSKGVLLSVPTTQEQPVRQLLPSAGIQGCSAAAAQVVTRRACLSLTGTFAASWVMVTADLFGGGGGGRGRAAHAESLINTKTSNITNDGGTTTTTNNNNLIGGRAVDLATLQEEAYVAYAERRFQDAVNLLTECIAAEPESARWREMRAVTLVDGKNFPAAVQDFEAALGLIPEYDLTTRARLLSGRALAYEGLSDWEAALADYRRGMELAANAGESEDPYVLNSIGNCLNSLGRWEGAREQYLASAAVFQQARGFRGRNGSTTPRLDGAIFASSNAALMRAQLGDTDGAVQEMVRIARRAPGSADMRAALAALYWAQGRRQEAEEMWEFACDRITVGCAKYTDLDWLGRIRRWPPVMVARMADFLALK